MTQKQPTAGKRPRVKRLNISNMQPDYLGAPSQQEKPFKWMKNTHGTYLGAKCLKTGKFWVKIYSDKTAAQKLCDHVRKFGFVGHVTSDRPFRIEKSNH
ncbi:MAG: hypothetical protein E6Q68_02075 [Polynucleobacter sp.]|nr:MAG: hypothetical protein E6Q68_02075 [Polynucleobacter sp.]